MYTPLLLLLSFFVPTPHEIDGSLKIDGVNRTFHLFIPGRDATKKIPLVVVLHGGGGTGSHMIRFTEFNELAEKDTFMVVYPEGWKRQWNDHRVGKDLPFEKDDVKFISTLIDYLILKHGADPERVFITGISNGAIMSLFLAQEIPLKIRAIAPVCGSIASNYAASYHMDPLVSVLIINGTADPLIKYEGGKVGKRGDRGSVISTDSMIMILMQPYTCKTMIRSFEFPDISLKDRSHAVRYVYPSCGKPTSITLIKVIGGGHTWPGGRQYLPKWIIGSVCKDFNATAEIWKFFKEQPSQQIQEGE